MHALFVYFNWENFLRNFWEVCTFRLVRIFTPEDMFASGKEIGKGCGDVHSISDFLFDFEPHKVSLLSVVFTELNDLFLGNHFMKGSEEEEFQNNREIRLPDDNLCDQNEL